MTDENSVEEELRIVDYPEDTGVELGQGWDTSTFQKKNSVGIVFVPAESMPGQKKFMDIKQVSDRATLNESLDISAEYQYKGIITKVKGRADFAYSVATSGIFESFSAWAKVTNGVLYTAPAPKDEADKISALFDEGKMTSEVQRSLDINPKEYGKRFGLLPTTEPLDVTDLKAVKGHGKSVRLTDKALEIAKKDKHEFYSKYGDSFVSEIHGGAELSASLIFEEKEKTECAKISASIEGSGWAWEASGSVKATMDKYSKSNQLKIHYYQTGGKGDTIARGAEEFREKIAELPKLAADNPVYYRIGLTRYDSLPNWPGEKLTVEVAPYAALVRRYFEYSSLYDDIGFILKNKNDFLLGRGVTEKSLKDKQDELKKGLVAIENILPNCSKKGGDACKFPKEAEKPDYDFRIRMPIMLGYGSEVGILMNGDDLRSLISRKWIEDTSEVRCKRRQKRDPGCLDNKQIDDYKSRIKVNYVDIVGANETVSNFDENKPWQYQHSWGQQTEHTVLVAEFNAWSTYYGIGHGKLWLHFGFIPEPTLIVGVEQMASSSDSKQPPLTIRRWGKITTRKAIVAEFRCTTYLYGKLSQGCLYFYLADKGQGTIKGTIEDVSSSDSKQPWKYQHGWGQKTEGRVIAAEFRAWSTQYGEGQGRLNFYI